MMQSITSTRRILNFSLQDIYSMWFCGNPTVSGKCRAACSQVLRCGRVPEWVQSTWMGHRNFGGVWYLGGLKVLGWVSHGQHFRLKEP